MIRHVLLTSLLALGACATRGAHTQLPSDPAPYEGGAIARLDALPDEDAYELVDALAYTTDASAPRDVASLAPHFDEAARRYGCDTIVLTPDGPDLIVVSFLRRR